MSHELEQIIINGEEITNFAFSGVRSDIWHRLGQQYDGDSLMTAAEAMAAANMDRQVTTLPRLIKHPAAGSLHAFRVSIPPTKPMTLAPLQIPFRRCPDST